jgi:hypothetical protein
MCYGDPQDNDDECDRYTELNSEWEENGSMWKKGEDGDIYPVKQYDFERWYAAGFYDALVVPPKACNNCYNSNYHIVNKCEKTELCERYKLDYLRQFDRHFYGTLCTSCVKDCKEEMPKFKCDDWVKEEDTKST